MAKDAASEPDPGEAVVATTPEGQPVQPENATPPESPETAQDTAASDEPQQPEVAEDTGPSFLDRLQEVGFQEVEDEDAGRNRLLEAYEEQVRRQQDYDRRLQQQEQELAAYRVQLHQRQQQQSSSQQAQEALQQPQGPQWPQFTEPDLHQVQKYRTFDQETGQYGWAPETPPAVRASAEEYQAQVEAWQNLISYRPQEFQQLVQEVAREQAVEALKEQWGFDPKELPQRLDINGEQAYVSNVLERYENVLFEKDPRTNQPDYNRLSQIGSQFRSALEEAEQLGIPSEAGRYRYAERVMGNAFSAASSQEANATARMTADEKKKQHLRNAARGSQQRTGSVPQSTQEEIENPQNPNLTPGEATVERMKRQGSTFFESFAQTPAHSS